MSYFYLSKFCFDRIWYTHSYETDMNEKFTFLKVFSILDISLTPKQFPFLNIWIQWRVEM